MCAWVTDILGGRFEKQDLLLGEDSEGEVLATIVRLLPKELSLLHRVLNKPRMFENVDVLYVHGWSDYFFQTELAEFWASRGARFYALDLRKYGRSLREYQTPGYIENLEYYDADIKAALKAMNRDPQRFLVLLGHSTGGLTLSLWAARHPNEFDAIILNSPWLEFQFSSVARRAIEPIIELSAKWAAGEAAPQIDMGYYTQAQHEVASPEHPLFINEKWRPKQSMPVRPGWFRAITNGHKKVEEGLGIKKPICVFVSEKSALPTKWDDSLKYVDSVLNVNQVARAALHLGDTVTIARVQNALHDIFLSLPEVRADAYSRMENWLVGILAANKH